MDSPRSWLAKHCPVDLQWHQRANGTMDERQALFAAFITGLRRELERRGFAHIEMEQVVPHPVWFGYFRLTDAQTYTTAEDIQAQINLWIKIVGASVAEQHLLVALQGRQVKVVVAAHG